MRVTSEHWIPLRLGGAYDALPPRRILCALYEFLSTLVIALFLTVMVTTFACRTAQVDGSSMLPTLKNNAVVLIKTLPEGVQRGDIVVISEQGTRLQRPIVKRIIALPGDLIDIDFQEGIVTVNGTVLEEPYIDGPTLLAYEDVKFPQEVADGKCFLMGDNRNRSEDSRSSNVGQVDLRMIFGRVLVY